ncbi:unnamed protein product, partial [Staurois parvus]
VEVGGGIGREGRRTLSGGRWRDWQRGAEDTEWRPGGIGREGAEDTEWRWWRDWQRGAEDTEWRSVEGFAEGVE